ncbi:hypothetical protein C0J52_15547 [Blattella germanica]|nr:hypothetical protein C0J52_15547 [Blattella germanica]
MFFVIVILTDHGECVDVIKSKRIVVGTLNDGIEEYIPENLSHDGNQRTLLTCSNAPGFQFPEWVHCLTMDRPELPSFFVCKKIEGSEVCIFCFSFLLNFFK